MGWAPESLRPLMKKAGVPRAPSETAIFCSWLICASNFFESSAWANFSMSSPISRASSSRRSRVSLMRALVLAKSLSCICQYLPCSPAASAAMAAGRAATWKLSGFCFITTRTSFGYIASSSFTRSSPRTQKGHS